MAALTRLSLKPLVKRGITQVYAATRPISTSKKNNETIAVTKKATDETSVANKNWVSYGFDFKDETEDRNVMNATMFLSITCCLVIGGFVWAYIPDKSLRDWAQREAFLELRRREAKNLPLVHPDYVPAASIKLPSDQELGDTEIII